MHKGSSGKAAATNVLQVIANNKLADFDFLYDGNYNCTAAGKAGGHVLNIGDDGTLDVSCMSQLPIYLSCSPKAECPTTVLVGGKCPFGYDGSCA